MTCEKPKRYSDQAHSLQGYVMYIRSMLYVPGDNDRKQARADTCGADAIVLDLEDSVSPDNREVARKKVRDFLDVRPKEQRKYQIWVRINALNDSAVQDLAAVVGGDPHGIVLPKIEAPQEVGILSHYLDALEARENLRQGTIKICAVATETPSAVLRLAEFTKTKFPRLTALNWGAEDLSAAVGATTNLDETGQWALTYRWARSAVMLAAKAAGAQALETAYVNYRDSDGLRTACRAAAQEGFTGRAAIHPDQVPVINEAFSPSKEDVEMARRILTAFDKAGNAGTVGIDGLMYDIPHLKRAKLVLALHNQYSA